MKKLSLRLFRKKPIRTSTTSSLTGSTSLPDSGFTFVANSKGASAALVEFSEAISEALEHIELDDSDSDGPFSIQLKKLERAVGEFDNASVKEERCPSLRPWIAPAPTLSLINLAFQCAAAVYEKPPSHTTPSTSPSTSSTSNLPSHRRPKAAGYRFRESAYETASLGGTTKEFGAWEVSEELDSEVQRHRTDESQGEQEHSEENAYVEKNEHLPALILAVRGSAGLRDHMVNLHSLPVPVNDFLGTKHHPSLPKTTTEIHAHAGFLNGAYALLPLVQRTIAEALSRGIQHIVFTGHSAGGAVANLLFLRHLLHVSPTPYAGLQIQFSCITFGAPPILSADIPATLLTTQNEYISEKIGINLAVVNEFDIVPRMDTTYMRALIDIYRAIYDLPPLMNGAVVVQETGNTHSISSDEIRTAGKGKGKEEQEQEHEEEVREHIFPPLEFRIPTTSTTSTSTFTASTLIAVDTDINTITSTPTITTSASPAHPSSEATAAYHRLPIPTYHIPSPILLLRKIRPTPSSDQVLVANTISAEEFEKLVYVRKSVHSRSEYAERVGEMVGWVDEETGGEGRGLKDR